MPSPLGFVPDGSWDTVRRNTDTTARLLNPPLPQARVYNSANISIPNATPTVLTFNSERFDSGNLHSTSSNTGRLTAPITGLHDICAHVLYAANITGRRETTLRLNGTTVIAIDERQTVTVAGVFTAVSISAHYQLAAGDYVEVVVFQDSGGALNVTTAGNYSPEFSMVRLGGYVNMGVG